MRLSRVQFTVRRLMIAIAVVGLFLAIFLHRERKIRRLDRLASDQERLLIATGEGAPVPNSVRAGVVAERLFLTEV
jgi:hypothetical protein